MASLQLITNFNDSFVFIINQFILSLPKFKKLIKLFIEGLFYFNNDIFHQYDLIFFGVIGVKLETSVQKLPDLIFWNLFNLFRLFFYNLFLFLFFAFLLFFIIFLLNNSEDKWLQDTTINDIFIFVELSINNL